MPEALLSIKAVWLFTCSCVPGFYWVCFETYEGNAFTFWDAAERPMGPSGMALRGKKREVREKVQQTQLFCGDNFAVAGKRNENISSSMPLSYSGDWASSKAVAKYTRKKTKQGEIPKRKKGECDGANMGEGGGGHRRMRWVPWGKWSWR